MELYNGVSFAGIFLLLVIAGLISRFLFGNKAPMADNLILRGIHNLLHKNSITSMHEMDKKGITKMDLDGAFLGGVSEDDSVAELFEELS